MEQELKNTWWAEAIEHAQKENTFIQSSERDVCNSPSKEEEQTSIPKFFNGADFEKSNEDIPLFLSEKEDIQKEECLNTRSIGLQLSEEEIHQEDFFNHSLIKSSCSDIPTFSERVGNAASYQFTAASFSQNTNRQKQQKTFIDSLIRRVARIMLIQEEPFLFLAKVVGVFVAVFLLWMGIDYIYRDKLSQISHLERELKDVEEKNVLMHTRLIAITQEKSIKEDLKKHSDFSTDFELPYILNKQK